MLDIRLNLAYPPVLLNPIRKFLVLEYKHVDMFVTGLKFTNEA